MESAKAAVKDFMSKAGHHDTTVHEKVAPAVTHETIERRQHEQVQTAIDKEVHQDHYHTSVQPVIDQARLPEQHHHNIIPVEHRSFEHDNADQVRQRLEAERAQFRDTQERVEGERTSSIAPVVAGEHIHHHVHETIQPVSTSVSNLTATHWICADSAQKLLSLTWCTPPCLCTRSTTTLLSTTPRLPCRPYP